MPLTSVNPDQFYNNTSVTPTNAEDEEVGNGIKVPQTSVPGANPMDNTAIAELKSGDKVASAVQSGSSSSKSSGSSIGKSIGSIGGSLLGGPIGGAVGGFLGDIFGGLFKDGGYVGYQSGGPVKPDNMTYGPGKLLEPGPAMPADTNVPNMNADSLFLGYITGALHQRDFGGTPDTLEQAAQIISKMLSSNGGQQNFAAGGNVQEEQTMQRTQQMPMQWPQLPQQAAPQAQQQMQRPMSPQQSANPALRPPQPMQSAPQPQLPAQPQKPMRQGYMQPLGMNMGGQPPLQPGQVFAGEGEVKGPGGPTDDAIPAKLSNGEYVMSAAATAFFGVDKLDKMNQQGKEGFMQSKMQVEANQDPTAQMGAPSTPAMPEMPMQGAGMMPQMPPIQRAKGGAAMQRTRGCGFMGI